MCGGLERENRGSIRYNGGQNLKALVEEKRDRQSNLLNVLYDNLFCFLPIKLFNKRSKRNTNKVRRDIPLSSVVE